MLEGRKGKDLSGSAHDDAVEGVDERMTLPIINPLAWWKQRKWEKRRFAELESWRKAFEVM